MKQVYGPFRLSAGDHEEDVPSGVTVKIKELQPSFVITEDGTRLSIDRGTYLLHGGTSHSIWRGEKRVSLTELTPGDEIDLCHAVIYGPCVVNKDGKHVPAIQPSLVKPHVVYAPFMSNKPLDELFNRPDAMKFYKATDVSQGNEIEELRRQVAELREKLADNAKQVPPTGQMNEPAKSNDPVKPQQGQQQSSGKRQLQPA